ncbi:MAG: hypothetical protein HY432_02955 [Candidatus Liptonbacteria bacterium]|nr:hypothetical protein [Candidatus Liptonbacteria bacterium]
MPNYTSEAIQLEKKLEQLAIVNSAMPLLIARAVGKPALLSDERLKKLDPLVSRVYDDLMDLQKVLSEVYTS